MDGLLGRAPKGNDREVPLPPPSPIHDECVSIEAPTGSSGGFTRSASSLKAALEGHKPATRAHLPEPDLPCRVPPLAPVAARSAIGSCNPSCPEVTVRKRRSPGRHSSCCHDGARPPTHLSPPGGRLERRRASPAETTPRSRC
jgi:hypothetical protein